MLPQYAKHFERKGKFNTNTLSWALQKYIDDQIARRIQRTQQGQLYLLPHAAENFDNLVHEVDLLIDEIFKGTEVTQDRSNRFKEYFYTSVIMDTARSLFGSGARIRAFGGRPNPNWKQDFIKTEVLSHDRSVLGVTAAATTDEIKAHFRKLVKTAHPDVGGDPNKFLELKRAYDNLVHAIV